MKTSAPSFENLFNDFYKKFYADRWPDLAASLRKAPLTVMRTNYWAQYKSEPNSTDVNFEAIIQKIHQLFINSLQDLKPSSEWSPPERTHEVLSGYIMDPASVFAALALQVLPGHHVFDACAAPGGKSLVLSECMVGQGELLLNELSAGRRENLKKVIQQYIPKNRREHFIWTTSYDANTYLFKHSNKFDRILMDVPCSGERHLLLNGRAQKEWSPKQSAKLALRQYSLLANGLSALKQGGRLVYSTCSLSPLENDGVLQKLLERRAEDFNFVSLESAVSASLFNSFSGFLEKTQLGHQVLPDQSGFGPFFFAILEKK